MASGSAACPTCGVNDAAIRGQFLGRPPELSPLIDEVGLAPSLRVNRDRIETTVNQIQRTYPQIRPFVCLAQLPQEVSLQEYGFWLFNHSEDPYAVSADSRYFGLLLVLDPDRGEAAFTAGFALEHYLSDNELIDILESAVGYWEQGQWENGIDACFTSVLLSLSRGYQSLTARS
ncbi:MAG: TPM domain-containing protein [Verrucomicrobiota bacterium]